MCYSPVHFVMAVEKSWSAKNITVEWARNLLIIALASRHAEAQAISNAINAERATRI